MVGNLDAVDAERDGLFSVARVQNSFYHHRPIPGIAEARHLVPCKCSAHLALGEARDLPRARVAARVLREIGEGRLAMAQVGGLTGALGLVLRPASLGFEMSLDGSQLTELLCQSALAIANGVT